jgi:hypothetical protein
MTYYPTYVGQRALIETTFRLNGVPTDPTIVSITSKSPVSSTEVMTAYPDTAGTFVRRSTGVYEASILVFEPGQWWFRVEGAGIVDAVNEYVLDVAETHV